MVATVGAVIVSVVVVVVVSEQIFLLSELSKSG